MSNGSKYNRRLRRSRGLPASLKEKLVVAIDGLMQVKNLSEQSTDFPKGDYTKLIVDTLGKLGYRERNILGGVRGETKS